MVINTKFFTSILLVFIASCFYSQKETVQKKIDAHLQIAICGKLEGFYQDEGNRSTNTIIVGGEHIAIGGCDFFCYCAIGDSIVKKKNTTLYSLYKDDTVMHFYPHCRVGYLVGDSIVSFKDYGKEPENCNNNVPLESQL